MGDAWTVESVEKLPAGLQPQISPQELQECERIIRADPEVQRLAKEVGGLIVPRPC